MAKKKKQQKTTKKKKSPAVKIVSALLSVAMICGIVFFIYEITQEVSQTMVLVSDLSEAEEELESLKEEEEALTNEIELLSDSDYVKTWARGEYLITKEGEEIYRLPSVSSDDSEE